MALITPNFDEIKDEVAEGTYRVVVTKGEQGEYKTGTQYVNWHLNTVDEEDPKNNGRTIFHKTPITGKGAFLTQKFYRAVTGEQVAGAFDTEQLYGRQCVVTIGEGRDREGNPSGYMEVKAVKPISQ